jgi:hypothetical protein
MLNLQLNTVALRLAQRQGGAVVSSHSGTHSSSPRLASASDSSTLNALLQTAPAGIRSWFQSWISSIPVSRYHSLPSHAVFQLLYAADAVTMRSMSSSHHHPFHGQEEPVFGSPPAPGVSLSTAPDRQGSKPSEDAVAVINRLLALYSNVTDVDKFWTALGEVHEVTSVARSTAAGHQLTPKDFPVPADDALDALMPSGGPEMRPTPHETHPIFQAEGTQMMYPSSMFTPPSRVGTAVQGHGEYRGPSLFPPTAMSDDAGVSEQGTLQWRGTAPWDSGPAPWNASRGGPHMVMTEDIRQQSWEAGQGPGNFQGGWWDRT